MVYKPSVLIKDNKMIPLEDLTKKELEDFIKKATITAYRTLGYKEKE